MIDLNKYNPEEIVMMLFVANKKSDHKSISQLERTLCKLNNVTLKRNIL